MENYLILLGSVSFVAVIVFILYLIFYEKGE